MIRKSLTITLIAVLVSGLLFFSGCRRHSHQQKAEFMVDYVSETLDLDENQKVQLNEIKEELLEKGRQMHANKDTIHREFVVQLRSEEIDQTRVKALIDEHRAQMTELIDLMVVRLAEFHKTLTPEQREKLVAKLEDFKKCHHGSYE
ncbi:MAG: Spy/CpxP family protein refolding chaperone [Desulfobacterales bacterium]|jgi:Spy/CpxP family protein refolding chaperone